MYRNIWLVILAGLGAVALGVEPTMGSHTENPDIYASALLKPLPGSGLNGNVEFQAHPEGTRLLFTLANGRAGKPYQIDLVDTNRCPGQDVNAKAEPFAAARLAHLAKVEVRKDGMAAATRRLPLDDAPGKNWKNVIQHAVHVSQSGGTLLACGVVQNTGPSDSVAAKKISE